MVLWGELRVEATPENLRNVPEFARDIGQQPRLTEEARFEVDLLAEEASANIVRHVYRPPRARSSRLWYEGVYASANREIDKGSLGG